jgi:hypothetical protein
MGLVLAAYALHGQNDPPTGEEMDAALRKP